MVGSGARSQDTTGPTARLHACALFRACLGQSTGRGHGRHPTSPPPSQRTALHVMTCMHDALPRASTRALDMRAKCPWGAREGRGGGGGGW